MAPHLALRVNLGPVPTQLDHQLVNMVVQLLQDQYDIHPPQTSLGSGEVPGFQVARAHVVAVAENTRSEIVEVLVGIPLRKATMMLDGPVWRSAAPQHVQDFLLVVAIVHKRRGERRNRVAQHYPHHHIIAHIVGADIPLDHAERVLRVGSSVLARCAIRLLRAFVARPIAVVGRDMLALSTCQRANERAREVVQVYPHDIASTMPKS